MKVHYFQRYHFKEDVSTANAMLLLSRLYTYSPEKFYHLLKMMFIQDPFDPEISFDMQKYNGASRPDAVISQPAFKIVVETKLSDWFYSDKSRFSKLHRRIKSKCLYIRSCCFLRL